MDELYDNLDNYEDLNIIEQFKMQEPSTPSTSGLGVAVEVERTPEGSLRLTDRQVLIERTGSGRLQPWRPENISVGEGIEVLGKVQARPRNLFPVDEEDEHLKNENIELKNKLEEYTLAMDKLQKDFDRVSSDFKKMEMNYSSLLKTAKVEIERKTKIINDLNVEKDMVVLKALQNKNQVDIRSLREITKPFQKGTMKDSNYGKKSIAPSADNLKAKCDPGTGGRKEESRFSSVDTVTSCNTDITGRLLKLACSNAESAEQWSDRTSDTKENMAKKDVEDSSSTNTQALSIRNRRKSMPAVRSQAKFSSDEECEDTYCRNETFKKCYPSREDANRQNVDKVYPDRYRHKGLDERNKVSETSSIDDRYSNYEPNRDTYHRNRNDKYSIDKHRARDRYDSSQRHRRYLSPERSRRTTRTEDYYQRQEYGRRRFLESPPPDKFHHYQQRNRESRSKHERDDPFDCDRRDRQQEKYPIKHKMASEHYEEPISKRQRTNSFSKYPEEEKRWIRDKGVSLEKSVSDLLEEMPQYTSCQSPDDYLLSDESSPLPIKEIMHTASIPLEDPRIQSKKYILKTVDKNAELSTVIGRNVDLKMVDLSKWGASQVDVPKALTRRPSQCSEEIVKEIYMDIDNPVSNMSMESGEIGNEDEPEEKDGTKKDQGRCSTDMPLLKAVSTDTADKIKQNCHGSALKGTYRIPKIKNNNQDKPTQSNVSHIIEANNPSSKCQNKTDDRSKDYKTNKSRTDTNTDKLKTKGDKCEDKIDLKVNKEKSNHSSLKYEQTCKDSIAAAKEMIAGDLELSDETSDNMETQEKTVIANTANSITDFQKAKVESDVKNIIENKDKISNKHSVKRYSDTTSSKNIKDDSKKQKGKRKVSKSKDTDKIEEIEQATDKKEKIKKDKKAKFNELFGGDSNSLMAPEDFGNNSLITPDDLGIVTEVQAPCSTILNYLPICEDAQDAVDVNVAEAVKGQSLATPKTLETYDTEEEEHPNSKSEKPPKTKSKPVNETKKRKQKKSESDLVASVDVPNLPQNNESCKKLVVEVATTEQPVLISPIEPQPQSVPDVPETNKIPQESTSDKLNVAKNILLKSDGSMKALATSTPQKVLQQALPDVGTVSASVEPNHSAHEHLESMDSAVGETSSTADALDPQKEIDVPDVRIFVKRRRRVLKKP